MKKCNKCGGNTIQGYAKNTNERFCMICQKYVSWYDEKILVRTRGKNE